MTLHTVGPENMVEDEHRIGKGYHLWLLPILFGAPILATKFFEEKWVIAFSIGAALSMLHEISGRLHDLCIRLRRTNLLLSENERSP